MSEVVPVRGILVAHGAMADGIVDAVRHITGAEADVLIPLSNKALSPQHLADEVRNRVGHGPTIVFTDLPSGSCGFAARLLARELPDLVVISGVNLPVLLEFVMLRDLPMTELVPRLLAKGRAAVACAPASLDANADRVVSGG
ncbi:MAG: PTS sugar transporter subunit IIA [Longimicrobiales bacterium]